MTPNQITFELSSVFAFTDAFSSLCFSLIQPAVAILFQTTALLLSGFLLALFVNPQRLALLSLIYRALLVGTLFILVTAISPLKNPRYVIQPLWNLSLSPSQTLQTTAALHLSRIETPPSSLNLTPISQYKNLISQQQSSSFAKSSGFTAQTSAIFSSNVPVLGDSYWLGMLLVGVWLIVTIIKLARLLLAGFYTAYLRQAPSIDSPTLLHSLRTLSTSLEVPTPALVSHHRVQIPFVCGLLRPTIVLPTRYASDFDTTTLNAVLTHELAHLLRGDCWWKHLASFVNAMLWVQPLVWVLLYRLEQTDELLCDHAVLHKGYSPHLYATILLNLAERLPYCPLEQISGVGTVQLRSSLGKRVQTIMKGAKNNKLQVSPIMRIATLTTIVCVIAGVTTLLTVEASPQYAPTPSGSMVPSPSNLIGKPAPSWSSPPVTWMNTPRPIPWSSLKGHITVIDFFRVGCVHCQDAAPVRRALYFKYRPQGANFIGFQSPGTGLALESNWKKVQGIVKSWKIPYPIGFDPGGALFRKYGLSFYPTVIVVDRQGIVRFQQTGYTPAKAKQLEQFLAQALKKP